MLRNLLQKPLTRVQNSKFSFSAARFNTPLSKYEPDVLLEDTYSKLAANIDIVKAKLNKPMNLAEKVVYGHLDDPHNSELVRGESYLKLRPDRVAI